MEKRLFNPMDGWIVRYAGVEPGPAIPMVKELGLLLESLFHRVDYR